MGPEIGDGGGDRSDDIVAVQRAALEGDDQMHGADGRRGVDAANSNSGGVADRGQEFLIVASAGRGRKCSARALAVGLDTVVTRW